MIKKLLPYSLAFYFSLNICLASLDLDNKLSKSIPLPIPMGLSIVEELRRSDSSKNVTSQRIEQKSVISEEVLNSILESLKQGDRSREVSPLHFQARDQSALPGMLNGTFTVYGRAASFRNRGNINTKIRLRARAYLDVSPDLTSIHRSKITQDRVFLELKIKNPSHLEKSGVHKYRILLLDEDALRLFSLNPRDSDFQTNLLSIRDHAIALNGKSRKVQAMFNVIQTLAQLRDQNHHDQTFGEKFIQPQFITFYTRSSYTFTEENYPLPVFRENHFLNHLKCLSPACGTSVKFVPQKVEYQLTIDDHITGFTPDFRPHDSIIDVHRYFQPNYSGTLVHYPASARAVELKQPAAVANLRDTFRSPTHQFIQRELSDQMKRHILTGFIFNKGKARHLSRMLSEKINKTQD
jgi:hypothetical protein